MIRKKIWKWCLILCSLFIATSEIRSQVVKETVQQIKTYPFSDANPVPSMAVNNNIGRFYPYFMFDAYSKNGEQQQWKVISLENEHIKVTVLPEVGGKVYGAIEKSTGEEFVYLNKVMKFRAIGSRGPWTSGGIEHNFGLDIGHAPWAASPVDYIIRNRPDGTAECIVGGLDLASRSQWRVTISIPKNSAYFETKSLLYNPTPYHHSYLSWENAAYKATDDLEFFFPGNFHIDHDGSARPWPIDEKGRDISKYRNNNFGSSKSYHVMGSTRNWFGGLWQNKNFGFGHWAPYADAPGKKLWIWSLARDGAIWEDLLTDEDGQYIEAQSGVKFNQADVVSGYHSPFKQLYLRPGYTETKYEVWFPVKGIRGIDDATAAAALHVTRTDNILHVSISPNIDLTDSLVVTADEKIVYAEKFSLETMNPYETDITIPSNAKNIQVKTIQSKLEYSTSPSFINRPVRSNSFYKPDDAERLFLLAEDKNSMRLHEEALHFYRACLAKEPAHVGALTRTAELLYRKAENDSALFFARRALSINTYDGAANYIYGVIEKNRGNLTLAEEAMSVAIRSFEFRSEAYRQLAELSLMRKDFETAVHHSKKAIEYNQSNIPAQQILCVSQRKAGLKEDALSACKALLDIDPLNHFARFELYIQKNSVESMEQFKTPIRNEFPHETYLEIAVTYASLNLKEEAVKVLELAPGHPMVQYWLAYLQQNVSDRTTLIQKATSSDPNFVFPFREESIPVLQHAISQDSSWKTRYYLALIYWSKGANEKALHLLKQCGNKPDFAPFYISRAFLGSNKQVDLNRAREVAPEDWRASQYLAEHLADQQQYEEAEKIWKETTTKHPASVIVSLGYARSLMMNKKYMQCLEVLKKVYVLPQEHANQGHTIYENANIAMAIEKIKIGKWNDAIAYLRDAKKWPEHLGSGEPFDPDNRLTDLLLAHCELKKKNIPKANILKRNIAEYTLRTWLRNHRVLSNYIGLRELKAAGENEKVTQLLAQWNSQSDSLYKWNLPGGVGGAAKEYLYAAIDDKPEAEELANKITANQNDISNRLYIEAFQIVYEKKR